MIELLSLIAAAPPEVASEGGNVVSDIANTFQVDWPMLVAQILNFGIVVTVLYLFAFKPVLRTIDDRQKKISDGLQYAEEMKTKLSDAERQHAETLRVATQEAQRILEEAKSSATKLQESQRAEAVSQAETIIVKARETTEREREQVLAEVRKEVARLVVETSAKVLSQDLTPEQRERFNASATQEIASRN
ncbi:MAG: F0F1 ATP synthase subunit B [Opitutales bacterium]